MTTVATAQPSTIGSHIHPNEETNNFMRNLAALLAHIYTTFSRISQNDRKEIVNLEQKYSLSVIRSSDAMRSQGTVSTVAAVASLILLAVSFPMVSTNDQRFVQKMSEHAPDIANLIGTRHQAAGRSAEALSQVELQKVQDKSNRAQSDGNIKEAFAQVLQAEIQRHRAASSGH